MASHSVEPRSTPKSDYYPACERCGTKFIHADDHAIVNDDRVPGWSFREAREQFEYALCKDCGTDVGYFLLIPQQLVSPTPISPFACGRCGGVPSAREGFYWLTLKRVGWNVSDDDHPSIEALHDLDTPVQVETDARFDFVLCFGCHQHWDRWLDHGRDADAEGPVSR